MKHVVCVRLLMIHQMTNDDRFFFLLAFVAASLLNSPLRWPYIVYKLTGSYVEYNNNKTLPLHFIHSIHSKCDLFNRIKLVQLKWLVVIFAHTQHVHYLFFFFCFGGGGLHTEGNGHIVLALCVNSLSLSLSPSLSS